ncbi:hypothetical protein AB0E27_13915 [Streptomyces sparsogenes]|uniref:hypothetical protein n=1 Tax=Streptomyces sparsogenes TaxID=67365 RepID=UPI003406D453
MADEERAALSVRRAPRGCWSGFTAPAGCREDFLAKVSLDIDGRAAEFSDVTFPGNRTELVFTTCPKPRGK